MVDWQKRLELGSETLPIRQAQKEQVSVQVPAIAYRYEGGTGPVYGKGTVHKDLATNLLLTAFVKAVNGDDAVERIAQAKTLPTVGLQAVVDSVNALHQTQKDITESSAPQDYAELIASRQDEVLGAVMALENALVADKIMRPTLTLRLHEDAPPAMTADRINDLAGRFARATHAIEASLDMDSSELLEGSELSREIRNTLIKAMKEAAPNAGKAASRSGAA